ncbi:MAG TPA: SPOR domain-containing protein [Gemmatimonadales bacterium]|nr:SPOR domain-containing protein [Gemmatimonadales bacterium]
MTGRLALLAALLIASPPGRLRAQTDPRLAEALRLAQSGQADSGRAIVRRLLARLPPSDSVYPEALLTAAKIAPDAQSVASNLNRIVVDYGSSQWADEALLLLTQLYYAQHDPTQTIQAAERLNRDYPDSPLRARASFSAARAYFELKNEARGCELIQQALQGAGDDVEFKNQVSFYAPRCSPTQSTTTTAGAPPSPPAGGTNANTPPGPHGYAVQVLAVKSAAQVDDMLTRLKVMGFTDARVVRDSSGYFKVRVGNYKTREEAQRTQQRVKTKVGGNPFVVDEP